MHEHGNIEIFPRQQSFAALHNVDLDSEPVESLAQLAADRPTAEHNHALRFLLQLVKNGFISEIGNLIDAFDFRNSSTPAGRFYEISRAKFLSINFDFTRRKKMSFAPKNVYPERLEAFLRIVRRDFGAAFPHSLENFFESELRRLSIQAPFFRFADLLDQSRGGNERLARNATEVQAIAAHQAALDQRDASAEASRSRCGHEPGRARADHDH